ncbi:DUF397 domain-containing protein [Nocardia otitidiscaviarum]|uniref:DUF397 domain-containing protein n=1 Tax=Nocardia otitidiscaviarum TaxID=1823 RepID=A0A516NQM1_9NOCA|nr:DUF397 domain-containing protein [Nocardia otitidiscaviarum]MCP9620422.1 DUF397 domain-containing protein [Nocardia otitidiscaviarum]QDP81205.1 DUF397 domain-containing protein [Nocardia otitidiscaviarum]
MTIALSEAQWFKSSKSPNASECVEVAFLGAGGDRVGVRDSKDPTGPALVFDAFGWDAFVGAVRSGRLDQPCAGRPGCHPVPNAGGSTGL